MDARRPALVILLLLAGCTQPTEPASPADAAVQFDAPTHATRDWWDYEMHHFRTGNDVTFTRIGVEQPEYTWFGMPEDDFVDYVMIMHFPAMGPVGSEDVTFDAHDEPITWLDFPLQVGKTWQTSFYWTRDTVTFTVDAISGDTATITSDGVRPVSMTYNATMGVPSHVRIGDYIEYHVVDHGADFVGNIMLPREQDLVFYHGRTTAMDDPNMAPGVERHTIRVHKQQASFALLLYDAAPDTDAVGHAEIVARVTTPNGRLYEAQKDLTDTGDLLVPFHARNAAGTWDFEAVVAGAGSALLEGIAYDVTYWAA